MSDKYTLYPHSAHSLLACTSLSVVFACRFTFIGQSLWIVILLEYLLQVHESSRYTSQITLNVLLISSIWLIQNNQLIIHHQSSPPKMNLCFALCLSVCCSVHLTVGHAICVDHSSSVSIHGISLFIFPVYCPKVLLYAHYFTLLILFSLHGLQVMLWSVSQLYIT